jgi:hypothetical protein
MDPFPDFDSTESPSVSRVRRAVPETGSFGKSTRRSRSRTGTPAARREDPTLEAASTIFSNFLSSRAAAPLDAQRTNSSLSASVSQPSLSTAAATAEGSGPTLSRYFHKEPTEVILRGFKDTHQYAAIREYERIGGRICEDYPRDPPSEQRRYKSDLRDPAALRTQPLTAEEKVKALSWAGGSHWIKITFESAEGAEAAVDASPQTIQGYVVYAELYRGVPPAADEAIPAGFQRPQTLGTTTGKNYFAVQRPTSTLPRSFTTPSMSQIGRGKNTISPTGSGSSSQTIDTTTLSTGTGATTATVSSGTLIGQAATTGTSLTQNDPSDVYCRLVPTAKKVQLLPAEQALLPQQSYSKRVMAQIPFLSWFTTDMIGTSVPRLENGEFDYKKASLYWCMIYWLDWMLFGIFEVCVKSE